MSEHIIKHVALKMAKYIMHCDHNNNDENIIQL